MAMTSAFRPRLPPFDLDLSSSIHTIVSSPYNPRYLIICAKNDTFISFWEVYCHTFHRSTTECGCETRPQRGIVVDVGAGRVV